MNLEEIDEEFMHTNTSNEEVEEHLEEEIENLLDDNSRKQVAEELEVLNPELQERAEEILAQIIFQMYREEIEEDEELDRQLEETAEQLKAFSEDRRENVLQGLAPGFRNQVRELLEE